MRELMLRAALPALLLVASPAGAVHDAEVPAYIIISGRLLPGQAVIPAAYQVRSPIAFATQTAPALSCAGTYTLPDGEFVVACDDGVKVRGHLNMLSRTSGYAEGKGPNGRYAFTYGLSPRDALKQLTRSLDANLSIEDGKLILTPGT